MKAGVCLATAVLAATAPCSDAQTTFFDLNATDIHDELVQMSDYKNKVTLVVNVATY